VSKPFYPVGAHVCRATGQSLGETRNGNVQFVLNFVVLGMPDPKNPDNYLSLAAVKQKPRSWYCVLNENTIGFARKSCARSASSNRQVGLIPAIRKRTSFGTNFSTCTAHATTRIASDGGRHDRRALVRGLR
jgi:hypothetical protein